MAGNARRKIDSYTQQMFDTEVDKPDHDRLLQNLFEDVEARRAILTELHGLEPLTKFDEHSEFQVVNSETGRVTSEVLRWDIAIEKTGRKPRWFSPSPIRFVNTRLEVLMNYTTDPMGRYERLIGFVDVGVAYDICSWPKLHAEHGKFFWHVPKKHCAAFFEVKSQWPTVGNLIRQLNIYKAACPAGFGTGDGGRRARTDLVVGPDTSVQDAVERHGYRLVTFDATGEYFALQPSKPFAPVSDDVF